jgi:hypothetical protein
MNEEELNRKYKKLLKSLSYEEIVKWYGKFLKSSITNELYGYFLDYTPEAKEKFLKTLSKITQNNIMNRYEVNEDGTDSGFIIWDNSFNEEAEWFIDEESANKGKAELINQDLRSAGLI